MTTRQYAPLVSESVASIGRDSLMFGTHSLRHTKATLIYRRRGNLRAVQILLGHTKIESTVRYLGVEVEETPETFRTALNAKEDQVRVRGAQSPAK
jgi:site-specific recombinase XerD